MNIHNETTHRNLPSSLLSVLNHYRASSDELLSKGYLDEKLGRLSRYFESSGLNTAVVAVSGGLDSALVLAMMATLAKQKGSPVKHVVPVLLPVFDAQAATGQVEATERGAEVCEAFGLKPTVISLVSAWEKTASLVETAVGIKGKGWARGQLVAYQRTPALYYTTSLYTESGNPAVLVGTTNYSEGAYLGYFGKASDGLVDLQPISDLYKREVALLATQLGVPQSILDVAPTGDMYDGRIDEEVFGASYDAVELFLREKYLLSATCNLLTTEDILSSPSGVAIPPADIAHYEVLKRRLEQLHDYNKHKYLGRSPAVHFDVLQRQFKGSWDYFNWTPTEN